MITLLTSQKVSEFSKVSPFVGLARKSVNLGKENSLGFVPIEND